MITIRTTGLLTSTLSLSGLADLIEAVYPELERLGPLATLFGRELIHAIESEESAQ